MQYAEKLDALEAKFEELQQQMADPAVINDPEKYRKTAKSVSELEDVIGDYRGWRAASRDLAGLEPMLGETDADLRAMAEEEVARLEPLIAEYEERLKLHLLPKDPNDSKDIVLEIRAGAGGDEASLFAAEIFRMYSRYAEKEKWRVEVTSISENGAGGAKDVQALISGKKVYSKLKYESGVHRVQRVPATETQGRIHTSTITVAVLPEADEVEVKIEAKDIRVDTFCSSGPGGQSVNTTYSAVRITHIPTNTVVSCQDEKSQIKNREKAMRVLRSRLYEVEMEKQMAELGAQRKSMVGTGDRSEKVRTYNFKENRVSDHRIGLTLYQLDRIIEGEIDPLVEALTAFYNSEKLKEQAESKE